MPIKKQSKTDSLFVSFENADQQIYGATGQGQREGKAIENIPIFDIMPDPMQPRRAMPSAVREGWNGNPQELNAIFERWIDLIKAERNADFPVQELFKQASKQTNEQADESGAGDDLHSEQPGPLEASFMTILNLAGSIKRDTLVNPITVARQQNGYQLETGERRWLAHHLLYILTDNTRYLDIKAVVMSNVSVWRQAAENNARADLNAIGKARQFAILLMDLLRQDGYSFEPMSAFKNERDFYAQVIDLRVPYGKAGLLLNAMGFKNRSGVNRHANLLLLDNEVWKLADDYNCPEFVLRDLLPPYPTEKALATIRNWWAQEKNRIVAVGNNSSKPQAQESFVSSKVERLLRPIGQFERLNWEKLKALSYDEKQEALAYLARCNDRIHDLEVMLRGNEEKKKR